MKSILNFESQQIDLNVSSFEANEIGSLIESCLRTAEPENLTDKPTKNSRIWKEPIRLQVDYEICQIDYPARHSFWIHFDCCLCVCVKIWLPIVDANGWARIDARFAKV